MTDIIEGGIITNTVAFGGPVIYTLLDGVIANGVSPVFESNDPIKTIYSELTGTGDIAATIELFGTHIKLAQRGKLLATMNLNGTTEVSEGGPQSGDEIKQWPYYYFKLSGLSGTDAAVTASVAV